MTTLTSFLTAAVRRAGARSRSLMHPGCRCCRALAAGRRVRLVAFILATFIVLPGRATGQALPWTRADSIVAIGRGQIGLKGYAWRDFMPRPGGKPPGSDLMVNLQIHSLDGRPLPTGLSVDSAWVRSSEGLWQVAPRPESPNGLDLMLRGGPKLATNRTVDVLVRLRLPAGDAYYLQVRRQPIGETN
jgi:hypothetical protein